MVDEISIFLEVCVRSLPAGSIYCLLALSYVLIFKATNLLNLCQGEIMMVGAYFCYSLLQLGLSLISGIILSIALTCLLAFILEKWVLRKIVDEPEFVSIMVVIGIGIFIRGMVGIVWGVNEKEMVIPYFDKTASLLGLNISYGKLAVIIIAFMAIITLELFFKYFKIGMAIRATASNRNAAMFMGVDVGGVFSLSWMLAAIVCVFPGIALSKINILNPNISLYGFIALSALVLGGVDSIKGTIVSGFTIGIAEGLSAFYIGGQSKHLSGFIVMFLVLMIRPTGFFGIRRIERV